MKEFRQEIKR